MRNLICESVAEALRPLRVISLRSLRLNVFGCNELDCFAEPRNDEKEKS